MIIGPGIRAVGFDMDGTLMDTRVDMVRMSRVVHDELADLGVPEEVMLIDHRTNSMDRSLAWLACNKPAALKGLDSRIDARAVEVEMDSLAGSRPFPGAVELVRDIKRRGLKVGILTRGSRVYVTAVLEKAGIADMFDAIVCRDDYPSSEAKPSPKAMEHLCEKLGAECGETLYVGDGAVDYQTAASAGSAFIGVDTGEMDAEGWRSLADGIETVPSVADLRMLR